MKVVMISLCFTFRTFLCRTSAGILLLLAACGPSEDFNLSEGPSVLRIATDVSLKSLNPFEAEGRGGGIFYHALFDTLVIEDSGGNLLPSFAVSWQVENYGRRYVFRLRQGASFSDGQLMTADDVVASFQYFISPQTHNPFWRLLGNIRNAQPIHDGQRELSELGVKALAPDRLEIDLETPLPDFLAILSHFSTPILSQKALRAHKSDWADAGNLVTSGAYRLKGFGRRELVLTKSKTFWDQKTPRVERIAVALRQSSDKSLQGYGEGRFDLIMGSFDKPALERLGAQKGTRFYYRPLLGTAFIAPNLQEKALKKPNVRLSLSLAVNRKALSEGIGAGIPEPALGLIPSGFPLYPSQRQAGLTADFETRLKRAQSLMAQEGFSAKKPLELSLRVLNTAEAKAMADYLGGSWEKIFVRLHVKTASSPSHYKALREGDFSLAWVGLQADYPDPESFLIPFSAANGLPYIRHEDSLFNALLEQSFRGSLPSVRMAVLGRAEKMLLDQGYVIPLYFERQGVLYKFFVRGVESPYAYDGMLRFLTVDKR